MEDAVVQDYEKMQLMIKLLHVTNIILKGGQCKMQTADHCL